MATVLGSLSKQVSGLASPHSGIRPTLPHTRFVISEIGISKSAGTTRFGDNSFDRVVRLYCHASTLTHQAVTNRSLLPLSGSKLRFDPPVRFKGIAAQDSWSFRGAVFEREFGNTDQLNRPAHQIALIVQPYRTASPRHSGT
ncbi:MAG: hypothetical protein K0Q46_970 [Rhodococcus erythropolis]|nr:hypothetical protein [Rhodococcus erythropolis]